MTPTLKHENDKAKDGPNFLSRIRSLLTFMTLKEYYLEIAILILAAGVHFFHLGTFPAFFIDEGTYIGFATSFSQTGSPAGPAGNFYYHPFLSWLFQGAYFKLILFPQFWTSSPATLYGAARALPAALSIVEVPLLYWIVLRVYRRVDYALLSAGLFATTPLSARYLRMVLLDCFLLFFLVLSIALLVGGKGNRSVVLSGFAFGLAAMSKLPALFFIPAFGGLFLSKSYDRFSFEESRIRGFVLWLVAAGVTLSVWPIYGTATGHYSDLLANLGYESVRTTEFALNLIVQRLVQRDVFLFVGLAGVVYGLYKRDIVGFAFTLSYIGTFLLRDLRVSSYYLIPVLPFISVLACVLVIDATEFASMYLPLQRLSLTKPLLIRIVSVVLILGLAFASVVSARGSSVSGQANAIDYLVANAPQGSLVVSSPAYSWTLHSMRVDIVSYDWFSAPWANLPHTTRTYLMVDPGFAGQVQEVPQLGYLYNQTRSEMNFSGPVPVEIRSTNSTVTIS